jgi:copper resistance protein B
MKTRRDLPLVLICGLTMPVAHAGSPMDLHMEGDPLLTKVMINRLEIVGADGDNPLAWDVEAWQGGDLQKLWIKSEGSYVDGTTESAELQLLYDRAVAPYWDLQAGWRADIEPDPRRGWLALGLQGLAPYFIAVDIAAFIGDHGRTALRLKADYDLRITRKLLLSPAVEVNVYGKDDPERGLGSGLSELRAGLRLRYEIVRQFAPYIGVEASKRYGDTADVSRAEHADDTWWLVGMNAWF